MTVSLASTYALVDDDEIKAYFKASTDWADVSDQYHLLANYISDAVRAYCGRDFIKTTATDIIDGEGTKSIYLRNWPILDATDSPALPSPAIADPVVYFDSTGNQDWVTAASQGLTLKWDKLTGELYFLQGYLFPSGRKNIKIVWTAGYASSSTVPGPLKIAVLDLMGIAKQKIDMNSFGVQSISVGQESTSFNFSEWPKNIKEILDQYRRQSC